MGESMTLVPADAWRVYAKEHRIPWSYHAIRDLPVGKVEFHPNQRPDVKATFTWAREGIGRALLSLEPLTKHGKAVIADCVRSLENGVDSCLKEKDRP